MSVCLASGGVVLGACRVQVRRIVLWRGDACHCFERMRVPLMMVAWLEAGTWNLVGG